MLVDEMESLLRNVDARLARVEQILPTLARRDDLRPLEDNVEVLKVDVHGLKAGVDALSDKVDTNHRHMLVLHEDVKSDIRLLAEHLADQTQRLSAMDRRFSEMDQRLAAMAVVLHRLDQRQ